MMNDPRLNFWPSASNGFFSHVNLRVAEAVAQRRERRIRVVIDGKDAACPGDAARGGQLALDGLERRVEHLHVGDAHDLDVEELAEGPARIVVRIPLRVIWRPGTW